MCSVVAVFGLAGCCTSKSSDPYFDATIKNVDQGGEMLSYCNITVPMRSWDKTVANFGKMSESNDPATRNFFIAFAKMLDLTSFKAMAQSSVETEKGLYIYKQFVLTDPDTKSILAGEAMANNDVAPMIGSLPADTRLALYGNFNASYLLKRLTEEFAATGDKELIDGLAEIKAKSKAEGVDIDAWAESASGSMILVVTGESPLDMKILIGIADKDGVLSNLLRKKYQPKEGESSYPITGLKLFPKAQLVYSKGCIMLVSDPKIMEKPAKMLGATPRYAKYVKLLPKTGSGFMIVDVNQSFATLINIMVPEEKRGVTVKPFSLAMVDFSTEDGIACTAVSDFSLPMSWVNIMDSAMPVIMAQAKKNLAKKNAAEPKAAQPETKAAPAAPAPTAAPAAPAAAPVAPAPTAAPAAPAPTAAPAPAAPAAK